VVPSAVKIFVGNKIDLRDSASKNAKDPKSAPIAKETAKAVIEGELKSQYLECSALTREGLKKVFEEAVRAVTRRKTGSRSEKTLSKNEGSSCNCQLI
jgi:GTPase SAR1 family protein